MNKKKNINESNKTQQEKTENPKTSAIVKKHPKEKLIFEGGKFCLDIAKLIFGGVILAGIMKQNMDIIPLFAVGLIVVLIFVISGFYIINKLK